MQDVVFTATAVDEKGVLVPELEETEEAEEEPAAESVKSGLHRGISFLRTSNPFADPASSTVSNAA